MDWNMDQIGTGLDWNMDCAQREWSSKFKILHVTISKVSFVRVKPSLSNIVRGDFITVDVLSLSHVTVTNVILLYKCQPD